MFKVSLSHSRPAFALKSNILASSILSVVEVSILSPRKSPIVGYQRLIGSGLNHPTVGIRTCSLCCVHGVPER